jgi:hypothetical protein
MGELRTGLGITKMTETEGKSERSNARIHFSCSRHRVAIIDYTHYISSIHTIVHHDNIQLNYIKAPTASTKSRAAFVRAEIGKHVKTDLGFGPGTRTTCFHWFAFDCDTFPSCDQWLREIPARVECTTNPHLLP